MARHSPSNLFLAGSFYRALVPSDVQNGEPKPETWGEPVAMLAPAGCDPITNFVNHSIVFGESLFYARMLLRDTEVYIQILPSAVSDDDCLLRLLVLNTLSGDLHR